MSRLQRLEKTQGEPRAQQIMAELDANKKLLNIFRGLANSPAALDSYLKFSGALKEGKLNAKTREAIALAVGHANKCEYCLSAHTAIGKGAGLDDASIREARLGRSADKKTAGAVTLARKLVETRGNVTDASVAAARSAGLDDGDIAETVANVAVNLFTNYFNKLNITDVGTDFPKVPVEIG